MSTERSDAPLRIAGCRVEPQLYRIDFGDRQLSLEPKVLAVLLRLAEQPGEVVTREELLISVWDGAFVTDDVLTRAITELRRGFHDDARTPRVIETIRKRGYRLLAPVEPEPDRAPAGRASDRARRDRHRARHGLAVGILLGIGGLLATAFLTGRLRPTTAAGGVGSGSLRIAPLTSEPGQERDPAVSPDGHRIAYVVIGEEDEGDLWLATRTGDGRRRLTRGQVDDRYPIWSPDGTRLAFVRLEREDGRWVCARMMIDTVGGAERRIAACDPGAPLRMDWSPDGRRLAIVERTPTGTWGLHLLDLDSLATTRLTEPKPPARGDTEPAFSPDGDLLAFTRSLGPISGDLYTVRLTDRRETRLTHDHRDIVGQAFGAGGEHIVFSSDRAGSYGLWQVPATGGASTWLAGSGNKIKHPSHARRSPVVAWEEWRFEIAIVAQRLDAGERGRPRPVVVSTQWDFAPAVSPSGDRLAFVSSRSGSHQIWILALAAGSADAASGDGPGPVQVTREPLQVTSPPAWSADGRRLAFAGMRDGVHDLWVLELGQVASRRVRTGATYVRAPAWSADGRSLYYTAAVTSAQPTLFRVWLSGPRSGSAVERLAEDVLSVRASATGDLYFVRQSRDGLWRLHARDPGAEPVLVTDQLPRRAATAWTLVPGRGPDAALWVEERADAVWVVALEGPSQPRRIARLAGEARRGLAVSPDGSTLYYATPSRAESDLLVGENLMPGGRPRAGAGARIDR